jgi:hypothetical protein
MIENDNVQQGEQEIFIPSDILNSYERSLDKMDISLKALQKMKDGLKIMQEKGTKKSG